MIKLETERLLLRNFLPNDWKDMLEFSQQYEKTELAKFDYQFPQRPEEMKVVAELLSKTDSFVAIEIKGKPKVIGLIQFQRKDKFTSEKVHDFGYIFNSKHHNKGYATEAGKKVLEYLFDNLKIDKCVAGTAVKNIKSCRLLERLGFKVVKEKETSIRFDSEGNPIMFLASEYELLSEDWKETSIV